MDTAPYTSCLRQARWLALTALVALAACSRQAEEIAAPDLAFAAEPQLLQESDPPALVTDAVLSGDDGTEELSAAAGLPRPMLRPLVPLLEIEFEYGTLMEFKPDPSTGARALTIEPIGLPLADALRSLEASLERAGFRRQPTGLSDEFARTYRPLQEEDGMEIQLTAIDYPMPELAAHPGGSGSVALRLQRVPSDH